MKNLLYATAVIAICSLLTLSCQKPTDCKATVKCVDSTGAPLKNTTVNLYATVKNNPPVIADIKASGITDSEGIVKFNFKLPAIFDIKAVGSTSTKSVSGTGLIRLEAGTGAEKTITLH